MPCACNIPQPNAPNNEVWGPILWKLLHGLSEKTKQPVMDLYRAEEKLFWMNLLKYTEKILPCPVCKEHYNDWLKRNNVNTIKTLDSPQLSIWIRNFFWELHNEVNSQNEKDSYPFESLSTTYKNVDFYRNIRDLEAIIKISYQHNLVSINSWQNWLNAFKKLLSIYGL